MDINVEVFLNQVAQDIKNMDEAKLWFLGYIDVKKKEIIHMLIRMILQAGVVENDTHEAIDNSKLKPTFTPCVLLAKPDLNKQLTTILQLPEDEYEKAFVLLMYLFKIVDKRRRKTRCNFGCNHWWHRNLADKSVVDDIISHNGVGGT